MVDAALRHAPPAMPGTHWSMAPPLTRYSLRVDAGLAAARVGRALPLALTPCRSVVQDDWAALWLGPDEQLLIGPESTGSALTLAVSEALQGLPYSLVDVSHRQAGLKITGPHALDLLNAGCPLDLDLVHFPVSACTRTVLAKSEIVLWRRANEQFHVEVWRSFVPYLTGFLAIVEREFLGNGDR
jgi:sarcosine oxidase, subunit gamma